MYFLISLINSDPCGVLRLTPKNKSIACINGDDAPDSPLCFKYICVPSI